MELEVGELELELHLPRRACGVLLFLIDIFTVRVLCPLTPTS